MLNRKFEIDGVIISRHAQLRALQRTQITCHRALGSMAVRSLSEGIDILGDPVLRELALKRAVRHGDHGLYAIEGIVFVFKEDTVVTVFPISWLALFQADAHAQAA